MTGEALTTARTYGDGCSAAQALDVVGERWALLIVRELVIGPKRFGDLRKALPGIRANVLTARLRELEAADVLGRRWLGPPTSASVYELTDWGHELQQVLIQLARWNLRAPQPRPRAPVSPDSIMLALRSTFDPARVQGVRGCLTITLENDRYTVRVDRGRLDIDRNPVPDADAALATDQDTLHEFIVGDLPVDEAELAGRATVAGDREFVRRLFAAAGQPPSEAITSDPS
jgi:DNA-binding HxlR family transcriptional regulator